MSDSSQENEVPIPRQLETPPRSTGNAQADYPILVDWIWRACLVIQQCVAYINSMVEDDPDLDPNNLPDPATSTVAQAQETANQAFTKATEALDAYEALADDMDALEADMTVLEGLVSSLGSAVSSLAGSVTSLQNIFSRNIRGSLTVSDAATSGSVTFATAQPNTNYSVMVQPFSSSGTPSPDAFIITAKNYTNSGFSFTLMDSPGGGNSITFDWALVRST